jgi:hypothetical protein
MQPHLPVFHGALGEQLLRTPDLARQAFHLRPAQRLRFDIPKVLNCHATVVQVLNRTLARCAVWKAIYLNVHSTGHHDLSSRVATVPDPHLPAKPKP